MGLIQNKDNERYMLFKSVNSNPKNWEYTHFISEMLEKYRKHLGFKGNWLAFRIKDHNDFTQFIKENIWQVKA